MKTFILFITIMLGSITLIQAQSTPNFSLKTPIDATISFTLTVDTLTFDAFQSRTGSIYILRTSKNTGNQYKSYLGYPTTHKYENHDVYSNKDVTEYWILGLTKNGYPKKVRLLEEQ
jgi:hypothetical protein